MRDAPWLVAVSIASVELLRTLLLSEALIGQQATRRAKLRMHPYFAIKTPQKGQRVRYSTAHNPAILTRVNDCYAV